MPSDEAVGFRLSTGGGGEPEPDWGLGFRV